MINIFFFSIKMSQVSTVEGTLQVNGLLSCHSNISTTASIITSAGNIVAQTGNLDIISGNINVSSGVINGNGSGITNIAGLTGTPYAIASFSGAGALSSSTIIFQDDDSILNIAPPQLEIIYDPLKVFTFWYKGNTAGANAPLVMGSFGLAPESTTNFSLSLAIRDTVTLGSTGLITVQYSVYQPASGTCVIQTPVALNSYLSVGLTTTAILLSAFAGAVTFSITGYGANVCACNLLATCNSA
jgi:hypothetical protein